MNALRLGPNAPLEGTLDELVKDYGLRPVLLTLLRRLIKRTRPPDTKAEPKACDALGLGPLSNRLRADVGLPPAATNRGHVDPKGLRSRFF